VSDFLPRIVITAGEPAGIGLDLCVMLANHSLAASITVVADQNALLARAKLLGLTLDILQPQNPPLPHPGDGKLSVMHLPVAETVLAGKLNAANSQYVLQTLSCAADGCINGSFDAMVTAPVHKGIINDAGIAFIGHTEFLAQHTGTEQVVMMLIGGGMRVALATTHLPLSAVSGAITQKNLEAMLRILHQDLVQRFGIARPRILVAGLNPHAGEGGYLGAEEDTVITPVLDRLRTAGMNLIGPLPADTLFTPHHLAGADCVLAMYHDQGLPVLKHASFGGGVNVTLGLPIIRTSVDHGTALDLAGKGDIEIGSLLAAIQLALELVQNRKKTP
jgi:4-hydroxythreonine-4-phosphate dehydrogenase